MMTCSCCDSLVIFCLFTLIAVRLVDIYNSNARSGRGLVYFRPAPLMDPLKLMLLENNELLLMIKMIMEFYFMSIFCTASFVLLVLFPLFLRLPFFSSEKAAGSGFDALF